MVFPTLIPTILDKKLQGTSGGAVGFFRGYPIVIDYFDQNDEFTIEINVTSLDDPENRELEHYWQDKKLNIPKLLLINIEPYSIVFTIKPGLLATHKTEFINSFTNEVIDYLIENNYKSCCKTCGAIYRPISCYVTNGESDFICESCYEKVIEKLEKEKAETLAKKSNFPLGLLGAFIGALLGCILYVYMYHFQARIKGAIGLVIGILSIKGYKTLGKNLDVKGAISCIILFIVMIFASHYISTALSYNDLYEDTYSFSYICTNLFSILKEHERYDTFFRHLSGVYVMCGMSSFGPLVGALFDSTGTYTSYKVNIKK